MMFQTRFLVGLTGFVGAMSFSLLPHAIAQTNAQEIQMAQSSSLAGSWRLVNMTEPSTPTPIVPPQNTELTADFADGRLSGSGGCNRFMGDYQAQDGQLSIGPLASTFKACEEPILNQETQYLTALQGAQRYEVDDKGELQIFYQTEQGTGILRFVSVSEGVQALW